MIDFSLPPELAELRDRTAAFVRDVVIPLRGRPPPGPTTAPPRSCGPSWWPGPPEAGLVSPHLGKEWGGLGLGHRGKAVVFEEAGYSALGPIALAIAAPDEGNGHLLEQVASDEQKERYLRPLAEGRVRSMFCHDRARRRGRLRPLDAAHRGPGARRRLAGERPEVADHRGRRAPPSP